MEHYACCSRTEHLSRCVLRTPRCEPYHIKGQFAVLGLNRGNLEDEELVAMAIKNYAIYNACNQFRHGRGATSEEVVRDALKQWAIVGARGLRSSEKVYDTRFTGTQGQRDEQQELGMLEELADSGI